MEGYQAPFNDEEQCAEKKKIYSISYYFERNKKRILFKTKYVQS